ncbi:MAG: hypothetical protein ACYS1A_01055 [Planctomycetota bacterium]|jgi:hypothetical protein
MNNILTALIGIIGVILGAGLNELLRRSRRIEAYTSIIFDKRLEKYEELVVLLHDAYNIATDVMENSKYTPEERHELISAVLFPIAHFTDDNELYIDPDIGIHCVATFMGAEDVQGINDPKVREDTKKDIIDMYVNAMRMIREDSGIAEIDKLFKRITKPHLSSPIIDKVRYLKKHPEYLRKSQDVEKEHISNNEVKSTN